MEKRCPNCGEPWYVDHLRHELIWQCINEHGLWPDVRAAADEDTDWIGDKNTKFERLPLKRDPAKSKAEAERLITLRWRNPCAHPGRFVAGANHLPGFLVDNSSDYSREVRAALAAAGWSYPDRPGTTVMQFTRCEACPRLTSGAQVRDDSAPGAPEHAKE